MLKQTFLLLLLTFGTSVCHGAPAYRYSLSGGVFHSEGEYGNEAEQDDTQMRYLPFTFKARQGPWTIRVQGSHIRVSGPGNVGDGLVRSGDQKTASGLGDTVVGLDHGRVLSGWLIEPGIRLKLPTAQEDDGLGTGSRDVSAQLGLTGLFPQWRPFLLAGYKWRGHSPLIALQDGAYANLGVDHPLGETVSVGLGYDWRQATVSGNEDGSELFGYASWAWDARWKITFYAAQGHSDASADRTLGSQIQYRW